MSKCCEKKVFKCEDMDGVGKIFVRNNAAIKAETPIRFKTDSGYAQETTFEKGVDISIDETAIKVDLSKYPKQEEVDNDISLAKDNVKDWVKNNYRSKEDVDNDISLAKDWVDDNYTKKEDFNKELSSVNENIQSGLVSVKEETENWVKDNYLLTTLFNNEKLKLLTKTEAEQTYLKKSDATINSPEYINNIYFDVSTSNTYMDTVSGLRISFRKSYTDRATVRFGKNNGDSGFIGLYSHGNVGSTGNTFEVLPTLTQDLETYHTYLNGIIKDGENFYRVMFIFGDGKTTGYARFSISGIVEKIK